MGDAAAEAALAPLQGQKYASLTTFRKNGAGVATPIWFAEEDGRLYVMTRSDSGKFKRLRNRSDATMAPCTMRGKVTGSSVAVRGRLLSGDEQQAALAAMKRKYFLMRIPWLWSRKNVFYEFTPAA